MMVLGGIIEKERGGRRTSPRDDGFTLLEVLVALGILGLSLSVLFGVFTMALDRTRSSATKAEAEHLAETLLLQAETVNPAELHDTRGTAAADLEWTIRTSPYGTDEDRKAWQGSPLRIQVLVQWRDHGRERSLSLSTIRIVPGANHG